MPVAYGLAGPDGAAAGGRPPARRPADPNALTRRELDVARLVARGLTDRQIADELSIAIATVRLHIHHVLAKLQLRSRWQVATALVERGLLDPAVD